MFGNKREPETSVILYHYDEIATTTDELADGETTDGSDDTSSHCAWCGDPPDAYGSHSICRVHSAEIAAQAAARRERLRRSRGGHA